MAIGRLYTVTIGSQAQTAAKTLIEITSAADSCTQIEKIWIYQTSFDTSENLGTKTQRVTTGSGGTGTATVPEPVQVGDAAFGGTVETNATIEPTYQANEELLEEGFNVLIGYQWVSRTRDETFLIKPTNITGISLDVAPSESMNFSYGCIIRETGG